MFMIRKKEGVLFIINLRLDGVYNTLGLDKNKRKEKIREKKKMMECLNIKNNVQLKERAEKHCSVNLALS